MAIETNNLKLLESERIKTDAEDGGGKYSGREIVDGQSNNLFNDISEMDRTTGRTSIQKIYAAVNTADTDALMGATVFISENPKDPNVSAVLFSTNSWTDERSSAQNRIENYLAKGAQLTGTPLDTHWLGMKSLQVAMFPQETESSIGASIVLISNEGKPLEVEQYLRITEVSTRTAILMIDGKQVEYKIATYGLSDALKADFVGLSAKQWYSGEKSQTIIRDTIVADTGKYYASANLKEAAQVGDYSVVADSVYTQLVPSAQTETPMVNINAAGDSAALVKTASGVLSKTFSNITVNTVQGLYIGSSVMPKSVEFTLFGLAITDVGGELKNSAGTSIGTINYQNGAIAWNANAGTGTTNLNITFMPAAAVTAPVESMLIYVNQENNGFNWIKNLVPLPSPGSLQFSYLVQNQVYTLRDNGAGQLRGSDSSFGSGSIDYETGTMAVTVGELADVGSAILLTWSNMITAQERSGLAINKAYVEIPVNDSIVAGTLTVDWLLNGVTKTATDNGQGQFTGDATGSIDYADGMAKLMPVLLPNGGTTFNVSGQKGPKSTVQLSAVPSGGSITVELDNGSAPLVPKSVKIRVPVKYMSYSGEVELHDMPIDATSGTMINGAGQQQGSINYTTRTITVAPSATLEAIEREKVMRPYYGTHNTSQAAIEAGMLGMIINYQNVKTTNTLTLTEVATAVTVSVSYRDESVAQSWNDTVIGLVLKTDLTEGFAEQILAGSVRLTLASSTYVDKIGSLYRNPSATTGAGTLAGQIQYGNGTIEISSWDVGGANNPVLESLATQLESVKTNQVSYRAPMIPIRAQSLTLSAVKVEGGVLNVVPDGSGTIDTADCDGFFNFDQGYGQFVFREKVIITEANRAEIMAQDWYVAELEYAKDGKQWIHKPIMVLPETIKYSAVGFSYIPIDADLLGLSAVRLPIDGRVPIFRSGEIGIVSASKSQELPDYIAGKVYALADQRISWCELEDADGAKVPFDMYVVDYDYGKVTLNGDFALGNLTGPLTAKYRYQDMGLVRDVKINGQVTFTKPLTHNYDPANTIVGSALVIGDMKSRYTRLFVQPTWNSVWSDEATGGAISANYNDALYPIEVSNKGSIQERWAMVFTDATTFKCVGEYTGELAQRGTTTADYAPLNPITNAPYFKIKKEGWGSGWANGNTMRFNSIGANYPIWVIRTVKQSEPTVLSDSFQIILRGDIDRVA
ncbi:hypothetical protein HYG93_05710 [Acinetobacter sp. SwsAc6]|uniref:hypothetical protein n=1 Tax=Acinetobacter sp. SwsAc6 TaxID=2749439 RepID=UPI0015BD130E|nr:hypothetical protein [Acinetobacter sp. SwsAc6]NWK73794.1 hypothetical protein [Acinetobacter sp. SwsAc6]